MTSRIRILSIALILITLATTTACATAPRPGDPEYPFNLNGVFPGSLTLGDSVYPVSAEIRTLNDGSIRGSLRSDGDILLVGDLAGAIRVDSVVWRSSWSLDRTGCSGVLLGWGRILPAGAGAEGRLRSEGSCPTSQGSGSFRFLR